MATEREAHLFGGGEVTIINTCPHCGFTFPPNHSGPCPNCGREPHSLILPTASGQSKAFKLNLLEPLGISDVVNASGASVFVARNIPKPEWWPEVADDIARVVEEKMPDILIRYDKAKEEKERRFPIRLWKILVIIFWIVVGAILSPFIARFLGI